MIPKFTHNCPHCKHLGYAVWPHHTKDEMVYADVYHCKVELQYIMRCDNVDDSEDNEDYRNIEVIATATKKCLGVRKLGEMLCLFGSGYGFQYK